MTDLSLVASRLSRAADLIEKLVKDYSAEQLSGEWAAEDDQVRTADGQVIAEAWTWRMTHHIAALDPRTVAALTEPLREAAGDIERAIEFYGSEEAAWAYAQPDDVVLGLAAFAARLLREEET